MRTIAVICAVLAACAFAQGEEYLPSIYGMQGLRVSCDTEEKLAYVRSHEGQLGFDFLRVARDLSSPVELLVAPDQLQRFKLGLLSNDIGYEVFVEDASRLIEAELELQRRARMNRARGDGISLKAFPRYDEIEAYVNGLAKSHGKVAEAFSIGKSYEGRDIVGVKISSGGPGKPALFIDAGIHAREWIAPSTAVYAIKQLVENATNHRLFDNVDIYIVPVLNPDGYTYTFESASTRLWRKTRSILKTSSCIGVDANRNFDYEWMTVGASSTPCSITYAGPKPFSEPETAALRDFILARKDAIKVYLSFHSYGQYLLHPWGFTSDLPKNEPVLRCAAEKAEEELSKLRGTRYRIGSSTNVLYAAAGGSDDWAMGVAGAELAYTVELPGGYGGFAPPPSEIIPVGRETFEAIKVFASFVDGKVCQNV